MMVRQAYDVGIAGSECLLRLPTGWLSILERGPAKG